MTEAHSAIVILVVSFGVVLWAIWTTRWGQK